MFIKKGGSFKFVSCTLSFIVACGGSQVEYDSSPTADAENEAVAASEANLVAAPVEAGVFPQVMRGSGTTIASPKVLPIVFAEDPYREAIADFTRTLGRSTHWTQAAREYGVGMMQGLAPIVRTDSARDTVDDTETRAWLTKAFAKKTLGAPSADTLYAVYYPDGVQVTVNALTSCKRFGGYHSEMMIENVRVSYAVIARCATSGTDRDRLTIVASHEYFEWATNPRPFTAPAYRGLSPAHWAAGTFGDELADMCPFLDRGEQLRPSDLGGYAVQRYWSNRQSAAGRYPCLPARMDAYAVAIPEMPDAIEVRERGAKVMTRGIAVQPGRGRTVRIRLQGQGAEHAPAKALAVVSPMGAEPVAGYRFELSSTKLAGGEEVRMTVTADPGAGLARAVLTWGEGDAVPTAWTFALTSPARSDDD
jgi:hypothetical protein